MNPIKKYLTIILIAIANTLIDWVILLATETQKDELFMSEDAQEKPHRTFKPVYPSTFQFNARMKFRVREHHKDVTACNKSGCSSVVEQLPAYVNTVERKVCADLTASYQGEKYYFPDAQPMDKVFFKDGKPLSITAVKVHRDQFGFDVSMLNTAASTPLSRNQHHTAHNQNNTGHWGSLNKRRVLLFVVAKTFLNRIQVQRNAHTDRTNDGDVDHDLTMRVQE